MTDLLLVVGEGILGVTAEGVFADNLAGHQRFTLDEFEALTAPKAPLGGVMASNGTVGAAAAASARHPTGQQKQQPIVIEL